MDDTAQLALRGICRGLHLAGYFAAFGAMFLSAAPLRAGTVPALKYMAWAGLGLALIAGGAWFWLQTAYFASAQNFADVVAAVPAVLQYTRFGALLLGRMALLLLAVLLFQAGRPRLAALLAFGGVLAEAWLGHGGAMTGLTGTILLGTAILHLGAASLWLGTLPALLIAVAKLADPIVLVRRYSVLGMGCVAVLLLTALIQYILLIGRPASLVTSGYGVIALVKIFMLAVLIAIAGRNKLRLTPSLPATRPALLRAIGVEIALGLVVLMAAGILLQLAPPAMAGMH
jgi:copper resistance protein D